MNDSTWVGPQEHEIPPPGPMGWLRALLRGIPLAVLVFGCLGLLLLCRLVERPLFGQSRPWTPHITVFVCKNALRFLGINVKIHGTPMKHHGAMVANHSSWLDIFSLNATGPLYFVSKSEVARWPAIGWLARATGTLFIRRDRKEAMAQTRILQERLTHGHRLLFFPEGTSTDGLQVIPFKTTLFAAFMAPQIKDAIHVQPASVAYFAPSGESERYYGWWGDMAFGPHLLSTLAAARTGRVEIQFHTPLRVSDFSDRKTLAKACEEAVRRGHSEMRAKANSSLQ